MILATQFLHRRISYNRGFSALPPQNKTKTMAFVKGKSGNPGGRPKKLKIFVDACQDMSDEILLRLRGIIENGKNSDAIKAMEVVLAYGFGRPTQAVELTGADGKELFPTPRIKEQTREEWLNSIALEQNPN